MINEFEKFEIAVLPIRLGQLLKLAEVVLDGNEAKFVIQSGQVTVNNETETRRGRQLVAGDMIEVNGKRIMVVEAGS